MKIIRLLLGLMLLIPSWSCSSDHPVEEEPAAWRPDANVLVVTLDTLRWDYLGSYGNSVVRTENLDRLARRGVRFEDAVVHTPLTTPSHASIFTGTYPPTHGIRDVGGYVLADKVPTLASVLKREGYRTAAFVSAAVLHHRYGLDRGFDVYNDEMKAERDEDLLPGVVAEVRGDIVTDRALQWLDDRGAGGEAPFFLWVHYYDPHFPYDAPGPLGREFADDPYAGEVSFTDQQVGRLLDRLDERGELQDTLIIVLSDHGESLGEHGEYTHGIFLYDSTMRIPLIMAGPALPEGRVVKPLVRAVDIFPTVLEYLGLSSEAAIAGESVLSLLGEEVGAGRFAYMETIYPRTQMGWAELRAVRSDDWKLIRAPRPELYALPSAESAAENVYPERRGEVAPLERELRRIERSAPPASRQKLDNETLAQLQSLGYVSSSVAAAEGGRPGPDPKDRVDVIEGIHRATELMNSDRFRAAVPVLQEARQADPSNPLIYQHLGQSLQRLGAFEKARDLYRLAIDEGAATDRTYSELGEVHVRLGEIEEGVEAMERAAEMNPRNLDNFGNLANAELQLGRLDDAERAVQAILAQNDSHAVAHNIAGMIHIQRRRPDLAWSSFRKSIESDPDQAEAYMNLGLLSQIQNRNEEALGYYREFLEKARDDRYAEVIPRVREAIRRLESGS